MSERPPVEQLSDVAWARVERGVFSRVESTVTHAAQVFSAMTFSPWTPANRAGIDLSDATFATLGLRDNDFVEWRFVHRGYIPFPRLAAGRP